MNLKTEYIKNADTRGGYLIGESLGHQAASASEVGALYSCYINRFGNSVSDQARFQSGFYYGFRIGLKEKSKNL